MTEQAAPNPSERRRFRVAALALIAVALAVAVLIVLAIVIDDDDEVLVVVPQALNVDVDDGDTVRVTGTVGEFEEVFDDDGDFDEDDFVIVADAVETRLDGDEGAEGESRGEDEGDRAQARQVEIDEVADDDDEDLLGQRVTVVAEVSEEDVGLQSFLVEEEDD